MSWGRVHRFAQDIIDAPSMAAALLSSKKYFLPYGRGRSYGDSCLNENGILLKTERWDHFLAFDRAKGILSCEAGVTLRDVLRLCHRQNDDGSYWFLPVTPGTKFVTVGGAIANDVHGKNHHRHGTFGQHVLSFRLRRSDGTVLTCSPTEHAELFCATIGGLGLTGLIEEVTLQLIRVPGLQMEVEDISFQNLDAFYLLCRESERDWDYTIAWVDCLARGPDIGRGIFSRGRHIEGKATDDHLLPALSIPFPLPISLVNAVTLALFNSLYRRKLLGAQIKKKTVPYNSFFYPLDGIGNWNNLYGKNGFYQYQCVIPSLKAEAIIRAQLEQIARSGEGSFLIVLKTFEDRPSPGLLSFPMPGTTLAIDFPNRGPSTLALLNRLDALTLEAGGRVYPAKDGRMASHSFQGYYPKYKDFASFIDPRFSSSFWRRVTSEGKESA
jgi:FAD/FMN-containing dehydrogenase